MCEQPRYKGVLLDFYGTLVHEDDHIIANVCKRILHTSGSAQATEEIARYWWEQFRNLMANSHGDSFLLQRQIAVRSLAETIRHFESDLDPIALVQLQFDHWIAPGLFADSAPFLRQLDTCGLPVCIVSNIDRSDLERAGAFHRFDFSHTVTSDDVRAYKPRSEMFIAALRILGCEPDKVLHIGDSRHSDIAGALTMGVDVAWVNRTSKVAESDSEATYTVRNLNELAGILC